MPRHEERRVLPYRPDQVFDLVAGIERYPEFLPWCVAARIRSRNDTLVIADLVIGFKMFRERFTSREELKAPDRSDDSYDDGPFKQLANHWV
ncbi:MAG: type II toxin-antitoxin system RatA family toxin, partial [Rhodospirillales bacterium]